MKRTMDSYPFRCMMMAGKLRGFAEGLDKKKNEGAVEMLYEAALMLERVLENEIEIVKKMDVLGGLK